METTDCILVILNAHDSEDIAVFIKLVILLLFFSFAFFCFSGLYPQHMEIPRLGVKSELQLCWAMSQP